MDPDKLSRAMVALVKLVEQLRGPDGCPWDARQTDTSIKIYLLEEAYEVLGAIEKSSPPEVCSELGDLLFQILFLAQMASERKEFDFVKVVEGITEKMTRRHPHVFGRTRAETAEDVARNWSRIKRAEKDVSCDKSSPLNGIPVGLPALLRAHRMSERASRLALNRLAEGEAWGEVQGEFEGLSKAVAGRDRALIGDKMGRLLFSLVNLARCLGLNAENLLRLANKGFLECFENMGKELKASGIELEKATPEQVNQAWEKANN